MPDKPLREIIGDMEASNAAAARPQETMAETVQHEAAGPMEAVRHVASEAGQAMHFALLDDEEAKRRAISEIPLNTMPEMSPYTMPEMPPRPVPELSTEAYLHLERRQAGIPSDPSQAAAQLARLLTAVDPSQLATALRRLADALDALTPKVKEDPDDERPY